MSCHIAVVAASPLLGAGLAAALGGDSACIVTLVDSWSAALDGDAPVDVLVVQLDDTHDAQALYDGAADRVRLLLLGDAAAMLLPRALADRRPLAVLSSAASPQQVRAAVTALLDDLQLWDPALPVHVAATASLAADEPPGEPLTPRELEVFELIAKGLRNRDIAQALGISEHTAKFHVGQILAKIGAASRAEAVGLGVRLGLIGA